VADSRGQLASDLRLLHQHQLEQGHGSVKKEPLDRVGTEAYASCPPMLSGPHLGEHHYHQQQLQQQHHIHGQHEQAVLHHPHHHHHHKFDFYNRSTADLMQDEQSSVRALSAHGYIPN
jgi:hypothetical protein